MINSAPQFLLVEPVAKTPYPPLGLLKISSMLKGNYPVSSVFSQVGNGIPAGLNYPEVIYITSLFTWDIDKTVDCIRYFRREFPRAEIKVGGIAASLLPEYVESNTGIKPHIGLLKDAESYPPDYSQTYGRKIITSITYASRGCIRQCKFCNVKTLEPTYHVNEDWEKDICKSLPCITFWDNNWLASPNLINDIDKLKKINKKIDFNQGLDARLYNKDNAEILSLLNINPIRFAFDSITEEKAIVRAIRLAKKYSKNEIRVYVLYNYDDTPEDFYHRIKLLNREGVLSFPMEYRGPDPKKEKIPNAHWDTFLLRAVKLTLLFYYRKGMITEKIESFDSIYGLNPIDFKERLYKIYLYDKKLRRNGRA